MINTEVRKNNNENNINLLRRFSRKVKSSGAINKAKEKRFNSRAKSKYVKKKEALTMIERRKNVEKLIKMGKMTEKKPQFSR